MTYAGLLRGIWAYATLLPWPRHMLGRTLEEAPVPCLEVALALLVPLCVAASALAPPVAPRPSPVRAMRFCARAVAGLVGGTLFFHVWAVLFGAPATELVWRTVLWSAMLSSLTALPAACALGSSLEQWRRLFVEGRHHSTYEAELKMCTWGAVLGAWLGAIPMPLDWDRAWQAWPLTCVYGVLGGHTLGLLAAALFSTADGSFSGKSQ